MQNYVITVFAALCLISGVEAQSVQTEKITIRFSDGVEVFNVCKTNPPSIIFDNNKEYFWYNVDFNVIKSSKGGCGGKLLHGNYIIYDEKGNLEYEMTFYLGLRHGDGKQWGIDGNITEILHFTKGLCDYKKTKSDDGDGWVEWTGAFLSEGTIKKVFNSYGILLHEELQLDSYKFKTTGYFQSGKIKSQYIIDALGNMYGDFIGFYESGTKEFHGIYDDYGFKIGVWKWYNEDGSTNAEESYQKGVDFYDNGKKRSEGSYLYDSSSQEWTKTGKWYFYKLNGEIDEILEY